MADLGRHTRKSKIFRIKIKPTISDLLALGMVLWLTGCACCPAPSPSEHSGASTPVVMVSEFISDAPPFPESHASTIVETDRGLLAAWFGGTRERHPDVCIWTARYEGGHWSPPVKVAEGLQAGDPKRYPCWNPVLFQPKKGPLLLFYKVGPSPSEWWGMFMRSTDHGLTWSAPQRLPDGQLGPVRNKPVQLSDGSLLCGSSTEADGWKVHMERTSDFGTTWERTAALHRPEEFGAIQPALLAWSSGKIQILNRSRQHVITESWMIQGDWKQWTPMRATSLPNPNSGIDALVLRDGRGLLVYNPSENRRTPISIALSPDGKTWHESLTLEDVSDGELSYPAVIQTRDGRVHITYTWKRQKIRHVVVDPKELH